MTKQKILIVEDNLTSRKFVRIALESEQYEVTEASTGEAALSLVKANSFRLVLMDLRLSDYDGLELAQKIRAIPEMTNVPIVAFTGTVPLADKVKSLSSPFSGFIMKPVESSKLLYLVKEHLTPTIIPDRMVGKKVLVVDDDGVQLRLTCTVLGQLGFKMMSVKNGVEALEILKIETPDVVLSDILMPLMDGFKLCLAIKNDPNSSSIPVVLVSSNFLEKNDQEIAKAAGAFVLVERTPHLKEVIEGVVLALDQSTPEQNLMDPKLAAQYEDRMYHQLERQLERNEYLSKQIQVQSIIANLSGLLSKHRKIENALPSVFPQFLDISGISFGAIFLKNANEALTLRTQVGFNDSVKHYMKSMTTQLASWSEGGTTISLPSSKITDSAFNDFLERANLKCATFTPILAGQEHVGLLLLGLDSFDMDKRELISLSKGVATQFAQAISLSQTVGRLNLSEDRARIFMENANDGIFVLDLHGKILEVNKKALDLFGRTESEMIGKNYKEFIVNGQRANKDGSPNTKNIVIGRPDGTLVDVDFSASPVQLGSEKFIFSLIHDVTERNKLEQLSLQSEKLASMGAMTAGVAHEINNPLSYVLTHVELLSDCVSKLTPETLLEKKEWIVKSMGHIKEGVDRVKTIASDLKIFSRSRDTEKDTVLDLGPILESSINMALHEIKFRARVTRDFQKISPVFSHEGRLGQVFLNLLVNAAQAIPEGNVDKNEIHIATKMDSGRVLIEIRDTGPGIPPEVLNRIFTPFFTTKASGVGTGLGLSICKNIVERFGGEITVESHLGRGSIFRVFLPESKEKVIPSGTIVLSHSAQDAGPRGRVLIVDDEPDLAEIYGQVLSQEHEVVILNNGRKAFELLVKDNNFDAILSDLTMPDMAGMDIYTELSKLKNGAEERFVFITGGVFTSRAQEFLKNLPNTCIEKPVETKVLRGLVQDLIRKRRTKEARS